MPFTKTKIPELIIYEPTVFKDSRGYFFESYNQNIFLSEGIQISFVQDNQVQSGYGVVRGLHFQNDPNAQTKLVRVLYGKILDVVVDIRRGSPTFGEVFSIELTSENKKQLLVPKGFAHGYSVLSDTAEVLYKCDEFYNKQSEGGIAYNDKDLKIDWGISGAEAIISEKDMDYPSLKNVESKFIFSSHLY